MSIMAYHAPCHCCGKRKGVRKDYRCLHGETRTFIVCVICFNLSDKGFWKKYNKPKDKVLV